MDPPRAGHGMCRGRYAGRFVLGRVRSRIDRAGRTGQRHRRPRVRDGRHPQGVDRCTRTPWRPIALAFAEAAGIIAGAEVLTAIVAGYEVGTRVGNAATMALFLRGFHPQGTSGVFVAAATAGRHAAAAARGYAACAGHRRIDGGRADGGAGGAMVKRLHAGRAAQAGVQRGPAGPRGFTGIADVLEAATAASSARSPAEPNPAG